MSSRPRNASDLRRSASGLVLTWRHARGGHRQSLRAAGIPVPKRSAFQQTIDGPNKHIPEMQSTNSWIDGCECVLQESRRRSSREVARRAKVDSDGYRVGVAGWLRADGPWERSDGGRRVGVVVEDWLHGQGKTWAGRRSRSRSRSRSRASVDMARGQRWARDGERRRNASLG
jgi:hypothetical protein